MCIYSTCSNVHYHESSYELCTFKNMYTCICMQLYMYLSVPQTWRLPPSILYTHVQCICRYKQDGENSSEPVTPCGLIANSWFNGQLHVHVMQKEGVWFSGFYALSRDEPVFTALLHVHVRTVHVNPIH